MLLKSPANFSINGQTPLQCPPTLAYSVVIPLFNDAEILPALHRRVSAVMQSLGEPYEIVYVDDGSRDNTFAVLEQLYQHDSSHVKGMRLLRNFGQHPAVTAGFEQTEGKIVITLDSDLQNPPEEIPKLLHKLEEGYDVVVGWRQIRQDSIFRTLPSKFINWLISRSTGVKLHDYGSMLRVYRRPVVQLLNQTQESAKFITALTSWLGVSIAEVPVRHEAAANGLSHYRLRQLFRMTIDLATSYSLVPIQMVTGVGLLMAAIGISAGVFLLGWRIWFGTNPTGLSSFVALLLVLFGIQLAGLGIIGEYIGRIYIEVRGRPYYLIRTILEKQSGADNQQTHQLNIEKKMSQLLKPLEWDSEFFGLPIGRIVPQTLDNESIANVLEQARSLGLRCLYFEADPDDPLTVAAAEQHRFHLVDVRIVLEHPFDDRPAPVPHYPISPELVITPPRDEEMPRLQEIAAQIGRTSRFDFDKNFGPVQSEQLYRLWIEKACAGFANVVFIARWGHKGEAAGLITCTHRDGTANIQLAGVHINHRQKGVGTALVQAALDWAKVQQAHSMQVVTQTRNVPAQRLYQQMGFFTKTMSLYYHKWL